MEEVSASAQELSNLSMGLKDLMGKFKVKRKNKIGGLSQMKRQRSKVFFYGNGGNMRFYFIRSNGFVRADEKDETINALLDRISNLERKVDEMNKKMEINKSVETAGFSEEVVQKRLNRF